MKKVIQKQVQKKLPPAKAKVTVTQHTSNKSAAASSQIPSGRIVMTPSDIKQMLLVNRQLKGENADLKKQIEVLEKTLMSAGIEVDEKFGDNEDHVVIPSKKELEGYKDVDGEKKTPSQILENQSEMDDDF